MERRLSAIVAADVVGFGRLMGEDEEGTLARLKACRAEIIDPAIRKHKGRIVKLIGDGLLAEFGSVVDAVRCAIEIQNLMSTHNTDVPHDRRIEMRIGINAGDVIVEGDDIYGDGVNIAARIEALADPGGVCVSGKVRDELQGKVNLGFEDLGARSVKNIAEPVRVYRIAPDRLITPAAPTARPVLFPEKPSIAVLPFASMNSDPEVEFFADGMSEEIITALSRVPDLFVISRNSTFVYKGRAVSVPKVAQDLGVKYILEGSVRAAGNRVRVTAQLIEGASGRHVWAERYDGELSDIFQVQDDITRNIALALQVKLTYGELARLWEGQTTDLRAWAKMVDGRKLFNEYNRTEILGARRLFEEAVEIDPGYAGALVHLGLTHWWEARYALEVDAEGALARAEEVIERLERLGNRDSGVHFLRGYVAFVRRKHDTAIAEIEQAAALSPSDSWVLSVLGQVSIFAGQPKKGIEALIQAMRLSPYHLDWQPYNLALGYAWAGENEHEAIRMAEGYVQRLPTDPYGYTNLAIVQAFFGHETQAEMAIKLLRQRYPGFGAKTLRRSELYKRSEDLDRVLMVLGEAGLPE
jgi:adenylate cyclase